MSTVIKQIFQKALGVSMLAMVATTAVAVPAMAQGPDCADGLTGGINAGVDCAQGTDQANTSLFGTDGGLFRTIVNILLFVIGAVAVIVLIYGGFRYVTSGGDASAVTAAKNTILYAVVGIVVAILAYAIVDFIVDRVLAA